MSNGLPCNLCPGPRSVSVWYRNLYWDYQEIPPGFLSKKGRETETSLYDFTKKKNEAVILIIKIRTRSLENLILYLIIILHKVK